MGPAPQVEGGGLRRRQEGGLRRRSRGSRPWRRWQGPRAEGMAQGVAQSRVAVNEQKRHGQDQRCPRMCSSRVCQTHARHLHPAAMDFADRPPLCHTFNGHEPQAHGSKSSLQDPRTASRLNARETGRGWPPSVSDGSACKIPEPPLHRPAAVGSSAALGLCRWTQCNLSCST